MEAVACRAGAAVPSLVASASRVSSSENSKVLGRRFHSINFSAVVLTRVSSKRAERRNPVVSAKANTQGEALQSLSNVVTDDAVPEGHKGLHGFLYGEGGAEVHGSAGNKFNGVEGEDDGNAIILYEDYVSFRKSFKFAGVFAIYDFQDSLQYVNYSRHVVSTLRSLRARVGEEKCSSVRVKIYTDSSLITRAKLEEDKQSWLDSLGSAPGNSTEKHLWEGAGNNVALMSEQEKIEYEEKKLKLRKAMGENLFDDVAGEDDDTRTRRLKLLQAVEGDDWSSVIDGQTKQTLDPRVSSEVAVKEKSVHNVADEPMAAGADEQIVSPFASGSQVGGGLYSAETYEFTVENVDKVLDEVRPYLIADGGNVEVVAVKDGVVSLRLQGACGTCPSSTSTMKMGIERVLMEKFGDVLKEVVQVDKQDIGASVLAVDEHLEMLRPAIRNYGGSVEVVSVDTVKGECQVKYHGPAPIGMGIQAAIKDKFPDIQVVILSAP
ncbi:uncharacterized protein [Physcomitrium patens]|uniref:NIF system FeS cluster assembly NifU C-terminal domain-containing protein n=1 Tax=Physcomitrium patens TaxID=3218 RepID=A0A2K1L2Q1_PHYPA|nr:uncharacterized protein LOC112278792 [Physcomitrium patens]PNR60304.1 hypothetical protein PHYPA_003097 [Physcomitrium patens]|eukprot:XP_024368329.1 uncharacterized protein LOC112278792 [Physcomitrella patens]